MSDASSFSTAENISLSDLLEAEDDHFEYKLSETGDLELGKKLAAAASAFSNSGGGVFVAGVSGQGIPDGGISATVGRQSRRDWADQMICAVEPKPGYAIKLFETTEGQGTINSDCVVMLVAFAESAVAPHMAHNKYYVRNGAHTEAARQSIVEAIWAKRHLFRPRLAHVFRTKPDDPEIIQLGIISLTNSPAVDVNITLSPLPKMMQGCENEFPLQIGVINPENPCFFDVVTRFEAKDRFGSGVQLFLTYHDLANHEYTYKKDLDVHSSLPSLRFFDDRYKDVVNALNSIKDAVDNLNRAKGS